MFIEKTIVYGKTSAPRQILFKYIPDDVSFPSKKRNQVIKSEETSEAQIKTTFNLKKRLMKSEWEWVKMLF